MRTLSVKASVATMTVASAVGLACGGQDDDAPVDDPHHVSYCGEESRTWAWVDEGNQTCRATGFVDPRMPPDAAPPVEPDVRREPVACTCEALCESAAGSSFSREAFAGCYDDTTRRRVTCRFKQVCPG